MANVLWFVKNTLSGAAPIVGAPTKLATGGLFVLATMASSAEALVALWPSGFVTVIVRPPAVKTESEMGTELTRIAEAVLR